MNKKPKNKHWKNKTAFSEHSYINKYLVNDGSVLHYFQEPSFKKVML